MQDAQQPFTAREDVDGALWWLFANAELNGFPPPGRMHVIAPALGYRRVLEVAFAWRYGASRSLAEEVRDFFAVSAPIPEVFGVVVSPDAWPRVLLPGIPSSASMPPGCAMLLGGDPKVAGEEEHPRLFVDPPHSAALARPMHPLAYAEVNGMTVWRNAWEEFFEHITFGIAAARTDRYEARHG